MPTKEIGCRSCRESFDNEDTSIDATIAAFRWILDNGDGRPPEDVYNDQWLRNIDDADSEGDLYIDSSASEGSQESGNSIGNAIECKAWVDRAPSAIGGKDVDNNSSHNPLKRLRSRRGCNDDVLPQFISSGLEILDF